MSRLRLPSAISRIVGRNSTKAAAAHGRASRGSGRIRYQPIAAAIPVLMPIQITVATQNGTGARSMNGTAAGGA